jgi:2-hydroxychromene-2-carboxylate isomerase
MSPPLDFYFDFSSPYGYLAAQRIEALAARHERTVDWHPILLGAVFKQTGMVPLDRSAAERLFEARLRRRAVSRYLRISPAIAISISTLAPARIVLWLKRRTRARGAGGARYRAFLSRTSIFVAR